MLHTAELYTAARVIHRAHPHLQIILLQVSYCTLIFSNLEGFCIFAEGSWELKTVGDAAEEAEWLCEFVYNGQRRRAVSRLDSDNHLLSLFVELPQRRSLQLSERI